MAERGDDISTDETLGSLLTSYLAAKRKTQPHHYKDVCRQAGLDAQEIEKILDGTHPGRGTLVKLADALELDDGKRKTLERVSGHHVNHRGFLQETRAEEFCEQSISMRRAVLLLTAPDDPSDLAFDVRRRGTPWANVATRAGTVFGSHDVVVRVTTPVGISVLDYSQMLFEESEGLRTVETIPLRDDMPIYLDKRFHNEHLGENEYNWATIFVQALGGERSVEFPTIFYEVARQNRFLGGIHLLTAAVTVGQFDSVVEVLASKLDILQKYVRAAQAHARTEYKREAHTITYFATQLKKRRPYIREF